MYDWAEFRHFRYLLAILEKQGFRAAADVLHTAQPNLSIQARQFQENATVRLYRRARNGRIHPTDTGLAFIALARHLLETRDEVIDALIAIERGSVGNARFGCCPFTDPDLFRALCKLQKEVLPSSKIRATHGDTPHLVDEVAAGVIDAALVTLPVTHPDVEVHEIARDRLVACLRKDHPLASNASLQAKDLRLHLGVVYHPFRHPAAHARLLELLQERDIELGEYSQASHPSELQTLVKEGHGFALIRERTELDDALTTRRIVGVDWTVDTAVIYHAHRHAKTIPILVKRLNHWLTRERKGTSGDLAVQKPPQRTPDPSVRATPGQGSHIQLKLL